MLFVIAANLFGCAGYHQPARPTVEQLSRFEPDCQIAEQQLVWLKSLLPTVDEKNMSNSQVAFFGRFSKEYDLNRDTGNGRYDYIIKLNIKDLYKKCAKPL